MSDSDKLAVETAINDMEGSTLLLDLAINNLGQGDSWASAGITPQPGYKCFVVPRDHVTALHHAGALVFKAAQDANLAFYGKAFIDELDGRT